MRDSNQSQFDSDLHRANNVLVAIKDFAEEVRQRKAISDVEKVVDSPSRQFKRGYVEQAPEYFTEYSLRPIRKFY